METLAFATAVHPPEGVKDKLMQKIGAAEDKEAPVIALQPGKSTGILRFAAAASVLVALASAVMAFTHWKKWHLWVKIIGQIARPLTGNSGTCESKYIELASILGIRALSRSRIPIFSKVLLSPNNILPIIIGSS